MNTQTASTAVLNHPMRLPILEIVAGRGPVSPKQIAAELGERLPNVSYHVRELANAGVIRVAGVKPVRGAIAHFYVVDPVGGGAVLSRLNEAGRRLRLALSDATEGRVAA